jgi:hypothetical protein
MINEKRVPKINPSPKINHGVKQPPKTVRPPKPPSQNKNN